jgi:hypothetical protein
MGTVLAAPAPRSPAFVLRIAPYNHTRWRVCGVHPAKTFETLDMAILEATALAKTRPLAEHLLSLTGPRLGHIDMRWSPALAVWALRF